MTRAAAEAALVVASLVIACGGDDDGSPAPGPFPAQQCSIGALEGTWRVHWTQTSGNCGPIPDSLVSSGSPGPVGCVTHREALSADRCRAELDVTCPTDDGQGSLHMVLVLTQTSATTLRGTVSATLSHPLGTCSSVYDVTYVRL